jgi:hypothetical protein
MHLLNIMYKINFRYYADAVFFFYMFTHEGGRGPGFELVISVSLGVILVD